MANEEGTVTHTWLERERLKAAKPNRGDPKASPEQWSIGCFPPVSQTGHATSVVIDHRRTDPSDTRKSGDSHCHARALPRKVPCRMFQKCQAFRQ